jgi:hypothetical protein
MMPRQAVAHRHRKGALEIRADRVCLQAREYRTAPLAPSLPIIVWKTGIPARGDPADGTCAFDVKLHSAVRLRTYSRKRGA